jgi:hypothetical protein
VAAKKHAFPDEMQKSLCKELDAAWNSLEWDWRRVEVGFRIAAALAEEYPEIGATYFEEASKVRNGVVFDTKKRATTFLLCTKIALRSFGYLLKRNRESVQNLSDMQSLIASVSSRLDRLRLWTELSLRYYSADRLDDCSRVCRDEVRPLLEDIRPLGHSDFGRALAEAAPALFCCQPETAIEQIKLLRQPLRDSALDSIARYILQRIPPDDAFSAPLDKAYDVDFDDVQKLFRVIGEIENDALSYRLILAIGCTVAHKKRETFSREQKRLVRERILHLSREKFPARGCIEHEGYAIAAEAQAHRIDGTGADWESLAERARCLPNSSDCVYVLLAIASCMPSSVTRVRQTIFDEAEKKANLLVSAHDRFTRLVELADALTVHDNANARRVVTMAGKVWSASEKGVDSTPRHLIDLAHRLDPELAAALAKELDDDPARAQVSRELRSQLEVKSLLGTLGEDELLPLHHREHLPQVAWTALGEINAGTRLPLQADAIWNLLQTAGELPLQLAYPVVSLAICSAGLRFAGTNQSSDILRSIFAGANIAASVTKDLVTRSPHRIQASEVEKPASGVLIANGEKNKAMIWLEQWCSVNVGDSIVICDGYFGLEDLSVVKLLASIARTSRFESSRRRKR